MRSHSTSYLLTDLTGGGDQGRPIHHIAAEGIILDLADRLRRLSPSPRNPERFHEEKSEIVHALRLIAREVGR